MVERSASPDRAAEYLERLAVEAESPQARRELMAGDLDAEGLAALHEGLGQQPAPEEDPAAVSVGPRLALGYPAPPLAPPPQLSTDARGITRLCTMPPLARTPLAPEPWAKGPLVRWSRRLWRGITGTGTDSGPARHGRMPRWQRVGRLRRLVLLVLTVGQSLVAAKYMSTVLPYQGTRPLEIAILALFVLLFSWVSAGFWTALMGFFQLLRGRDRHVINAREVDDDAPLDPGARTALVVPICNEDVPRVFAGVRATLESLRDSGQEEAFDLFILSDTSDPDVAIAETHAWLALCRELGAFGRVFYRRRQRRVKRKSGNLDDFCRRWGRNYRYMLVLDADSVMTGSCLTRLVRLMEANPQAGIIQTAPKASGRHNLYARMQQFATRVYGPLFTAGLHFWQLGESHYWGHNAIIRMEPFMRHCLLAPLPGKGSLSGEILSHDFVEAALMRRAGWGVWIAYNLPGSYEEMPPNLLDELNRDRRWCHGNLMNFRLFLARGIHPVHRAVFLTGVMSYLSAPLWCLFLILSTALLAVHTLATPQYFPEPGMMFPVWPQWNPGLAVGLFSATATLLFLPKVLSVILISWQGARQFGGVGKVWLSMVVESLFSMLMAPVRMLFHTRFVLAALLGRGIQWRSPSRDNSDTTWGDAVRNHGVQTLIGAAWAAGVYALEPTFLWWLAPIVGALMVSIPVSVFSSRVSLGLRSQRARLFRIPEETRPPRVLRRMVRHLKRMTRGPAAPTFPQTVVDPVANALGCALATSRHGQSALLQRRRKERVAEAVSSDPRRLAPAERLRLLDDPVLLSMLHFRVWADPHAHPAWRELGLPRAASLKVPGRGQEASGEPGLPEAASLTVPERSPEASG
ncbi:glucans biosynthesis glucosyltransferase MdoH [Halomonas maura]|uniref:glucans biosynthesis glucosyltransferase MdoH n=1 Tax=Halomonas maura TaxID=117606 RepID=UPI0025B3EF2C|nr:glucans biosynthesis glucosyltransferase MdoH [Halomonas maura]MDN3556600.1 glucans biosynthesis glucosyltransferase MdoH [Halomonas maura]